ncbi:putative serine threonine protein kinase protein [Rosellinia necatrix]|uniref:Putative serine threonine protein kinase protein n=1 Tax=Rosellinia necatrix TaxID=77044 RepID=A0A1W2TWA3_ROSNE|nr:putative serine threonine protein kinase protein [Rosellinia necatrix]
MGSRDAEELEQKLKQFFAQDPRFRFVKALPSGATGDCVCFEERDTAGRTRKIVLKYPNDSTEETIQAMENEIKWVQILKHAEHTVNPIYIRNGPNEGLTGLDRVFIILEYLENGSLSQFVERAEDVVLPNRILWSIFLCLTRACVAMAWPPEQGQPEEVQPNVMPSALAHWDMHGGNMLFGHLGARQEHGLVPPLKLIDFDNSDTVDQEKVPNMSAVEEFDDELELAQYRREQGVTNPGIHANVLDVGLTMVRIVAEDPVLEVEDCREFIQNEHPLMDDDLQLLIVRCLAADPGNRPKLDELLHLAWNAVFSKTYRNTQYENYETDARVREIIQRFILNTNA